ncbi:hypothetical protein BDV95DRAFT_216416 [Massariosphaeria phaeospora]|uniref:Probable double zinc ribbon domain-containing protein n=1 Tax=Massariosphaeria phaeospora TaxID=100035 RepID=A0A7C8ICA3_9PLEO|nr:hypothetical protein BDV95DRAFT_216416 [Massariosphaeria phaeospora]
MIDKLIQKYRLRGLKKQMAIIENNEMSKVFKDTHPLMQQGEKCYYQMDPSLWTCCSCGSADNDFIQTGGPHPVGFMNCKACSHTYCTQCSASADIITFIEPDINTLVGEGEVPFGILCPSCGLSWRLYPEANSVYATLSLCVTRKCACGYKLNQNFLKVFALPECSVEGHPLRTNAPRKASRPRRWRQ